MNNTPKSMQSSIWAAAHTATKKRLWNFRSKGERGAIPELPNELRKIGFTGDKYQLGEYIGTLADLKEFAKIKGLSALTHGAIKYKI